MKKLLISYIIVFLSFSLISCSAKNEVTPDNFPLAKAEDALLWAKDNGVVVCEDGNCNVGYEIWEQFYNNTENMIPSSVVVAHYYTLDEKSVSEEVYKSEKDSYPRLFFILIEYDGEKFNVTTRQSDLTEIDSAETFDYLLRLQDDPHNTNDTLYALVNDPDVTWYDLEKSIYSSQSDDFIKHQFVLTCSES